jgi:hypothetical protein
MAPTNLRKRRTTTTVVGITERSHGGRYGPYPLTEYPLANLVLHPVGSYTGRSNTDTSHHRAVPRGDSMAKGVLLVMTEPLPGKEDEFNDWYSNVHLHELVKVPGIAAAQRFEAVPWSNGAVPAQRYLAVYEFDADVEEVKEALAAARSTFSETPQVMDPASTVVFSFSAIGDRAEG